MTADNFAEAARAEAERVARENAPLEYGSIREAFVDAYAAGMQSRTHLAAQEPTDAELDAAHAAFTAHSRTRLSEDREFDEMVCVECGYATTWPLGYRTEKRATRHAAREAILAARAARRDEEKR